MMNPIEKLRQVQVNHRPIARFQIPGRFGDRRVRTTVRSETMTAGVEGRFIDRLQYLEHGLLNHPGHHVRNAKPALTAAGLGNPNPPDIARTKAFRQQVTSQRSQQARSLRFGLLDRLAVDPRCALVAYYVQQRPCEIRLGRHLFKQPIGIGRPGGGTCHGFALRCVQQPRTVLGCVRVPSDAAPLRAVGEHEAQLTVSRPSQPISPFAQPAFTGVVALTKRSDFCVGIVPSSLPPPGLPLARTPTDLPG